VNFFDQERLSSSSGGEDDGGDGGRKDDGEGGSEEKQLTDGIQRRLYTPFELTTNSRRRIQISLIQVLGANVRHNFNRLFAGCQKEKMETINHIREKIQRIRAILRELGVNSEEVPEPKLNPNEIPESILAVEDWEVPIPRYITAEEKAKIEAEKKAEEERQRNAKKNDAGARALQQMMGTMK